MKSRLFLLTLAVATVSLTTVASASATNLETIDAKTVETAATPKLSDNQKSKIANSCSSIRQNLKNLQKTDARARTYFGAIYETIANKFLKPLNLRLVNNDLSNTDLAKLQSTFAATRTTFSDDYIAYSKSLESLISVDCRLEPEKFYEQLVETREKRAKVAKDIKNLNDLATSSIKNVEKLKESLHD